MELQSSLLIPAGVISASIITGAFSFISLVNQKEGKISEFRQDWIDSLKNDIAVLLSSFNTVGSVWRVQGLKEKNSDENETKEARMERFSNFNEKIGTHQMVVSEKYYRVFLNLNEKDHKHLLKELDRIQVCMANLTLMDNLVELKAIREGVLLETQKVLKTEWERVKAGETSYKVAKYGAVLGVLMLLTITAYIFY